MSQQGESTTEPLREPAGASNSEQGAALPTDERFREVLQDLAKDVGLLRTTTDLGERAALYFGISEWGALFKDWGLRMEKETERKMREVEEKRRED